MANSRYVTEKVRSSLAAGMREARDAVDDPTIKEEMSKEMDRIMRRWWPKTYRTDRPTR